MATFTSTFQTVFMLILMIPISQTSKQNAGTKNANSLTDLVDIDAIQDSVIFMNGTETTIDVFSSTKVTPDVTTASSSTNSTESETTTEPGTTEILTTESTTVITESTTATTTQPTTENLKTTTTTTSESTSQQQTTISTTVTTATTQDFNVTNSTQVCSAGFFGLRCGYRCFCRDPGDICDPVYGFCSSGCPSGWYGPGCIVETRPGSLAIVVVLSILLVLSLLLCLLLCFYIIHLYTENEKNKFRRMPDSPVGGGVSYHGNEAGVGPHGSGEKKSKEKKTTIPRIKDSDIQIMNDTLGKGKFGSVNRGFVKKARRNIEVVFKTLQADAPEESKREFSVILELHASVGNHENIITFYGICAIGGQVYAAFEYACYGDLRTFLRKNSVPESQRDSNSARMFLASKATPIQFALDVVNGMLYLSSKQMVHGHLCAKNILLGSKYKAKISGFKPNTSTAHIVQWLAPETIHEMKFTHQSDVWSFGVLLWEIVTFGSKPYSDVPTPDLYSLINTGYRMPQPDGVDDKTYGIMRSCWQSSPEERPSFSTLSTKLREMLTALEFQTSMEGIDDIDLEIDDDLDFNSSNRFGRMAFDNTAYDFDA